MRIGTPPSRASRLAWVISVLTVALSVPAFAQVCTGSNIGFISTGGTIDKSPNCVALFYCYPPELLGVRYETVGGCDPETSACAVRAVVPGRFPSARKDTIALGFFDSPVKLTFTDSGGGFVGSCGNAGGRIQVDEGDTYIQGGNFSCSNPGGMTGADVYTLTAVVCDGVSGCEKQATTTVPLTPSAAAANLCNPPLPPMNCDAPADASCSVCLGGEGPGSTSVGGGGPGVRAPGAGPGAELVYQAAGAGNAAYPKPADWSSTLGRFWSHDYAERIVQDPDDSHVVLLTRWATYREFTDGDADDVYETASPGDEYRTLTQTVSGWELRDLYGTIDYFDTTGRWTQRVDKNGNAKVATYNASQQLESIAFPDGRSETFTYAAGGKVETISEVGVDGTTTRTWTYTWTGDDLTRIDRPDGTAWRFEYTDALFPGYMTKLVLVGTDASERVERGWSYDASGNVTAFWKGANAPTDPGAVDVWGLSFDDPSSPGETTVTDPLGNTTIYTLGRDASSKPRLTSLSDSCPVCGVGPNSQLAYEDAANPLRPTQEVDGDGTVTRFAYDSHGQMTSRIEDFGGALERETVWDYDVTFPALVTETVRPSVTGNPLDERASSIVYDASGNETSRTISGFEDGTPFNLATTSTPNSAGRVLSLDPPGYGPNDVTSFTYDPARGDLALETRTEPLVGTTTYSYDTFNRWMSATDSNGTIVQTEYDNLDRVRFMTRCGTACGDADDLITEYVYNVFGDLFQTILPKGNVIEYGYDTAGRLETVERKPDALPASHGERMVYGYDGFGHQVREEFQHRSGAQWVLDGVTEFEYSSRCHLDKTIEGAGTSTESVTEYAYDCDGNLERIWDANHPSAGQTVPASTVYSYDDLDRLETVTQPWGGVGGGSSVTSYTYDVQDHLGGVTDAEGNVTSYTYSDRDLLTEEVSTVTGTTTHVYNEHGALTETTDARGVVVARTRDELDRATFVDYPDDTLDITYAYDDPMVPFSLGRLTQILRDGGAIDYAYDSFGRITQDGAITYAYDENDNRTEIGYPGGVTAVYTHDYADREVTLDAEVPGEPTQPIVTSASYYATGPLRAMTLGNGVTETRLHDSRYHPDRITVAGASTLLDWDYTTDGEGNPTSIADVLNATNDRAYAYQDYQYFLTQGDGPWGTRAWTYDQIGNRLTETRDGQPADVYSYPLNGSGGNDPRLSSIALGAGGMRSYSYDAEGNGTAVSESSGVLERGYDAAARLSRLSVADDFETRILYDGRGFFRSAERTQLAIFADGFESGNVACWSSVVGGTGGGVCSEPLPSSEALEVMTIATYSSVATLYTKTSANAMATETQWVLYFEGWPVSVMTDTNGARYYLPPDHLGTPAIALSDQGSVNWAGGFGPFGEDYGDAFGAAIFLRFPGQWMDSIWLAPDPIYYNLYRSYSPNTGRYNRPDPIELPGPEDLEESYLNHYTYAAGNTIQKTDPLGLMTFPAGSVSRRCRKKWNKKVLPRLANPSPGCESYFCTSLGTSYSGLVNGPLPFVASRDRPARGGDFVCDPLGLGAGAASRSPDEIRVGRRSLCGRVKELVHIVVHELGHYADCLNGDKFRDEQDGCGAEVACLGFSVGSNCHSRGYPGP